MKHYLAIDIGASSGRHIVGWQENREIVTREVYRFPNGVTERDGHLTWDMEEHKPAGIPEINGQAPNGEKPEGLPEMNGEQPADGQTPPEPPDGEKPEGMPQLNGQAPEAPTMNGLLKELLDAEVITQAEYDALSAAQTADAA